MEEQITIDCHEVHGPRRPVFWRPPEGVSADGYQGYVTRTCSYCGSMHPADLVVAIACGAKLGGSDWKYGWPHKFYVDYIPNPIAGQKIKVGSSWIDGIESIVMGVAKDTAHGKFYNDHLQDLTDEDFKELSSLLVMHTGIEFTREAGKTMFRAAHHGFQR